MKYNSLFNEYNIMNEGIVDWTKSKYQQFSDYARREGIKRRQNPRKLLRDAIHDGIIHTVGGWCK